jgi:hypothetical protein
MRADELLSGQNRVGPDNRGHLLQRLLPQPLADLGQGLALPVAAEAVDVAPTLLQPTRIKVKQDGKCWRILDYDFMPRRPGILEVTNVGRGRAG